MTLRLAAFFFFCPIFSALALARQDSGWTQWRGSNRDSVVKQDWPERLDSSNLTQLWSKPFGPSYSGPIVFGNTVITTESRDRKTEVVTALDSQTGEIKWTQSWPGSMTVPFFAARNGSWIRSTPATDGKRVYVAGMLGRFVCLDLSSGKEIWSLDLPKKYGVPREDFGHVCSPLIVDPDETVDSYIYLQCCAGFIKLNRLTGEQVWRTLDGGNESMMSRGAFSSPIVAKLAGRRQLVVQTRTDLAGVELETGEVLWKQPVPNFRGMNILTPTVSGDLVFTSSYQNRSFGFRIQNDQGKFTAREQWIAPSKGYMSSPVIIGNHVYLHLQSKRMASINLETGKTNWTSGERFGDYCSMITNGKQILALDSNGKLLLIEPSPEKLKLVGSVNLDSNDTWAHLAIDGDQVFVRGLKSLSAYRWSR